MLGKAEFTGERFIPGIEDQKLTIEHMQRYKSIIKLVKGKKVIDIACGEGYGTAMLAEVASEIMGVDIDVDTIGRAQKKYKRENLRYQVGSVEKIPAVDMSVDVIVSFETIEHVAEELQQAFLKECTRVLKTGGMLIMSTPNKEIYSDQYNYVNEYHVHEFYHDEYLQFLKQEFKFVELYNQAFQVVSLLNDCGNKEKKLYYFTDGKYETQGKYYIAIASNEPIAQPEISSLFMCSEGEYERLIHRILQLQREDKEKNEHIAELDKELEKSRIRIVELQNEEEERNCHIAKLDKELEQIRNKHFLFKWIARWRR